MDASRGAAGSSGNVVVNNTVAANGHVVSSVQPQGTPVALALAAPSEAGITAMAEAK